jgi:serine/threonine protein kinase
MGMVFLGRDVGLDRVVAIKILRPELASAQAAERFLREARLLAKLKHQSIVPIHLVGERHGLSFYIMAHLEGETLASRLARGPLSLRQAVNVARDILAALEAAHAQGIVHRDVKPDNIILEEGRAILTDFGIAKSLSDGAPPLTTPGQTPGTLEYMPPEQAAGGEVTARTDLYAAAMVLYEAITGRHWSILTRPEAADWSGIPRRVRRALRKALAWFPGDRFPDAPAFQRALWSPRPQPLVWPAVLVLAMAAAIVGIIVFCEPLGFCTRRSSPLQVYELMVLPFDVEGVTSPRLGRELAWIVSDKLALFPQIALVPRNVAFKQGEARAGGGQAAVPVHVAARVAAWIAERNDTLVVRLEVRDSLDRRLYSASVARPAGAEVELADSIVMRLLRWLHPELLAKYGPRPTWGLNAAALAEFLQGEDAFRRDRWSEAARHFQQALRLDPSFARAAWRLANAQRWRRMPPGVDLHDVLAHQSRHLNPLDSLLIAAELAPHGEPRYRIYNQALALYPREPYARLLYGAELMHRGPLAGIPLDSGAAVLEEAVAQDPYLAPAHDQLVWALIRLGRRDDARRALERLKKLRGAADGEEPDISTAASLEVAYVARFTPESLRAPPPDVERDLASTARFGLGFDVPELQLSLGKRLGGGSGHEAQGLALLALGRPDAARAQFDSAANLFGTAARQLETLEWRLLPAALGVPGLAPDEATRGRRGLASAAAGRGPVAARAAWASAVDAYARGDSAAGRHWRSRLRGLATGDTARQRLDILLAGLELAARGNTEAALARTAPLLAYDEWQHLGDPFARAVLHARRAEWLEGRSLPDSADRSWLWYENSDFAGWLSDTLQAVEIDWALGTWSRWRRGTLAQRAGGERARCAYLKRVLELWRQVEPPYEPLVAEAQRLCSR